MSPDCTTHSFVEWKGYQLRHLKIKDACLLPQLLLPIYFKPSLKTNIEKNFATCCGVLDFVKYFFLSDFSSSIKIISSKILFIFKNISFKIFILFCFLYYLLQEMSSMSSQIAPLSAKKFAVLSWPHLLPQSEDIIS